MPSHSKAETLSDNRRKTQLNLDLLDAVPAQNENAIAKPTTRTTLGMKMPARVDSTQVCSVDHDDDDEQVVCRQAKAIVIERFTRNKTCETPKRQNPQT